MRFLESRSLVTVLALLLVAGAARAGDVYLGITMTNITPSMARALQLDEDEGVLIDEVVSDSPADTFGLEAGDVIIAIDGRPIAGSKGLAKAIHRYDPGDEVTVTVLRAGDRRDLDVVLGTRKKPEAKVWPEKDGRKDVWVFSPGDGKGDSTDVFRWGGADGEGEVVVRGFGFGEQDRGFLGIIPRDLERGEGKKLGLRKDRGVMVVELVGDGPAQAAGLEAGDVIVALDGEDIRDGDELHDFLVDTEPGETITVRVMRDGRREEIDVELGETPGKVQIANFFSTRPGAAPRFYSETITPDADVDLERERAEVEELKQELEQLKQELQTLREELNEKK